MLLADNVNDQRRGYCNLTYKNKKSSNDFEDKN